MKSYKAPLLATLMMAFALILASCAQEPERPEDPWVRTPPPSAEGVTPLVVTSSLPTGEVVDYDQLKANLQMQFPADKLGYRERSFNTCRVASGFSSSQNCRNMYLIVVHYNLSCRYSEDTLNETLTADDIHAVANKPISWVIKNNFGITRTDENGNAEIAQVYTISPRRERIRLSTGTDFLYTRVNELTAVVAPGSWCTY